MPQTKVDQARLDVEVTLEGPQDRRPSGPPSPTSATGPSSGAVLWIALVAALLSGVSGLGRPPSRRPPAPTRIKVLSSPVPVDPTTPRLLNPGFSDPTAITNPLFPVSGLQQVVQVGSSGGEHLRFETTLLPETRTIEWAGRPLATVVTQLVAYSDGRVVEVARDFHAQADDGAVWHFGEESANYDDGVLVDREGSWLAGRDGRPAIVMPAQPRAGATFRSQASPGQGDEVTVQAIDQMVAGPRGPVTGAMVVQERLGDGTLEDKTFAAGYGELHTRVPAQDESYSVAVAVPTDAVPGPVPDALVAISSEAQRIGQAWDGSTAMSSKGWEAMVASAQRMTKAWARYGPTAGTGALAAQMGERLADLVAAVSARRPARVARAVSGVAHASLDLQLLHRPPGEVDRDRLRLWARQVVVDAAAGELGAVDGDLVVLDAIWARTASVALDRAQVDASLAGLRAAATARDLTRAATLARALAAP